MSEHKYSPVPATSSKSEIPVTSYEANRLRLKNNTVMTIFFLLKSTTGIGFFTIQYGIVKVIYWEISKQKVRVYFGIPLELPIMLSHNLGFSSHVWPSQQSRKQQFRRIWTSQLLPKYIFTNFKQFRPDQKMWHKMWKIHCPSCNYCHDWDYPRLNYLKYNPYCNQTSNKLRCPRMADKTPNFFDNNCHDNYYPRTWKICSYRHCYDNSAFGYVFLLYRGKFYNGC